MFPKIPVQSTLLLNVSFDYLTCGVNIIRSLSFLLSPRNLDSVMFYICGYVKEKKEKEKRQRIDTYIVSPTS